MSKLLDLLFCFCTHSRYTFPMRVRAGQRRPEAAAVTGIYVVCLDCGKELAYSWDEMKVVPASTRVRPDAPHLGLAGAQTLEKRWQVR
jgi:hypothetical protein